MPSNSILLFDLETSFNKGVSYLQETDRYNFTYSFDIEKAEQQSKANRKDFGEMKNKKRKSKGA